jgi:DNA-binding CsgD family transcriptional regulator
MLPEKGNLVVIVPPGVAERAEAFMHDAGMAGPASYEKSRGGASGILTGERRRGLPGTMARRILGEGSGLALSGPPFRDHPGAPFMRSVDFRAYNGALAMLIAGLGAADFGSRIAALLATGVTFDDCLVLLFHASAPPEILHVTPSEAAGSDYVAGPYLLDPFYEAFRKGRRGCFRLRDLAPAEGGLTEDFLAHYRRYDIGDEIGLILPLRDGLAGHVSLSRRRANPAFARADSDWLAATGPLIEQALRRHQGQGRRGPDPAAERLHDSLNLALANFGRSVLTEREVEVTRWLLRGYAAKATARRLAIAGTVRNHLKSIYAKLGVTSHAELFALFFQALQAGSVAPGEDPLGNVS